MPVTNFDVSNNSNRIKNANISDRQSEHSSSSSNSIGYGSLTDGYMIVENPTFINDMKEGLNNEKYISVLGSKVGPYDN